MLSGWAKGRIVYSCRLDISMRKIAFVSFIGLLIASLIVLGINFNASRLVPQTTDNLLVSAAASLKDSLEEIKLLYQQTKSNSNLDYNFGASGALQQQIENGAPVDVFISAANKQMDALASKGLILADTRRTLLTNRLVLIVPSNSSAITSFEQLTSANIIRIAIGEPRSVPAGEYAQEVFQNLGILAQIKPKFVLANNVRQVLAAVESGNADAGVVYATDARISPRVKQVVIAPEIHSPIVYPIAVLKNSKNVAAAREYVQFLLSEQAQSVFRKYGFGVS